MPKRRSGWQCDYWACGCDRVCAWDQAVGPGECQVDSPLRSVMGCSGEFGGGEREGKEKHLFLEPHLSRGSQESCCPELGLPGQVGEADKHTKTLQRHGHGPPSVPSVSGKLADATPACP